LREYAVVPAHNVLPLPKEMSLADATVIEPLAVLLHSVELARFEMTETVLVMGAGPIGVLGVVVAKLAGASRIIVADRVEHRLKAALEMGADAAVHIDRESVRDAVMDLTDGLGVHVAFDAAGKPDSINTALSCLRFGGRLVVIGIPSEQFVGVDMWRAMHQEISIHVQKRSNANDHEALDMLRRGQIDTARFVSHRFPLERGHKAFETIAEYSDGVIKAIVEL
jgi:L-iditol 2-dehydrogenase